MSGHRHERLNKILQQQISQIVQFELSDQRLDDITIEYVVVAPDLRDATVFFSVFDQRRKNVTLAGLESARKYLHRKLAESLNLRVTPKLHFKYHDIENRAQQLENILENEKPKYETE